jgi:hypothetical protein
MTLDLQDDGRAKRMRFHPDCQVKTGICFKMGCVTDL